LPALGSDGHRNTLTTRVHTVTLFGGLSGAVQGTQFEPVNSLVIVLFAYVGGITTVAGALTAGILFSLLGYAESSIADLAGLVFVAIGAAAIGLGRQPNGIAGLLLESVRRIPVPRTALSRRPRLGVPTPRPVLELEGDR